MIDLKKTTQAFSSARQDTVSGLEKTKGMSAEEAAKLLGENENLGDYLNKVANPNYVQPSRVRSGAKNELGKDDFLKLMLAQMKHQDPTNPLKSHEMAAQMAQFTSVEQLTNINKGIEAMGAQRNAGGGYDALAFIGKVASGDSAKVYRTEGNEAHEFNFTLLKDAADVEINVKDAAGNVVKTLQVKDLKQGKNSVNWQGMTEDGLQARKGEYYFTVQAKDRNGTKVHAETKFEGKISGVKFSPQGPILLIGQRAVSMSDVQQIVDPTVVQDAKGQNAAVNKPQDLKKAGPIPENNIVRKQAAAGNIDSVPMDRGLINKLAKLRK